MITNENNKYKNITCISENEQQNILCYLQGAVYCWCKNRKNENFSLRDLVGGENYFWQGTPLFVLYEINEKKHEVKKAVKEAGKIAGHLLKKVVIIDKRKFETYREGLIRKYKWVE